MEALGEMKRMQQRLEAMDARDFKTLSQQESTPSLTERGNKEVKYLRTKRKKSE